jgi:MFS superfamily sulfate permease-like transporter
MKTIAHLGSGEIWLVIAGAVLVVALPIETGMVLAIILSLIHGIYSIARPPSTELRRVPGTTIWWPPDHTPNERVPGVLVFAPAAPIMFTNVQYIIGRLRALVAAAPDPVKLVVIEASGVIDIDYTGARMLCPVIADLHARNVDVAFARVSDSRAQAAVTATGLSAEIGPDHTFRSVQEAIDTLKPASSPAPSK